MKIKLRSAFKVLAWVIGIFIAFWLILWIYVIANKRSIISEVNKLLTSKIKGEIRIGDLEPSVISTFPMVSLRLSRVIVRDTLWKQHHRNLLEADHILIRLGVFSLFHGKPQINKVIMEKGSVYLFSDSTGNSNLYLFNAQNKEPGKPNTASQMIPDVELRNMHLVLDLSDRNKLYDISVGHLVCNMEARGSVLQMDVRTNMKVHSLAFNTANGSFAKEKPLEGRFALRFDRNSKVLECKSTRLLIDQQKIELYAKFDLATPPMLYYVTIAANDMLYSKAARLVSSNISKKLDRFSIEEPIDVSVVLDGTKRPNLMPLINLEVKISNSKVTTPYADFTHASLMAYFNNRLNPREPKTYENSGLTFTGVSGTWEGIAFNSDTIAITNLITPLLQAKLHADFELKALNELLGSNAIEFTKGSGQVDIRYKGVLVGEDPAGASIFGNVLLKNAAIRYIPRNLLLTDCSGKIDFADKDVYVRQLKAESGSSQLVMNGTIRNCVTLIDRNPEKLLLDWNIASSRLNLGDFTSFLGKRAASGVKVSARRRLLKMANRVDRLLENCSVGLTLRADRLTYKKFTGTNVAANLTLTDRQVIARNVSVQHAGGTMLLNGDLSERASGNQVRLNTSMNNVDVTKVFTAFNNFGQDGITDANIRGRLTANINGTVLITEKAEIVQNSLKGIVDLSLKDGALINFEPVQNISRTAFKNRDFSNVRFAELKERLDVNGSAIKVNRMEIQSSVFTMFVEGMYDIIRGTDLSIQIPLSNLAKRGDNFELRNRGVNSGTGVSLRLRAKTGKDGKAKISWDPFRAALKSNRQPLPDSAVAPAPADSTLKRKP